MGARALAFALTFGATAAWAGPAAAASKDATREAMTRFASSVRRVSLENGLRVVLQPQSSSPTVAVSLTYRVGSRTVIVNDANLEVIAARGGSTHAASSAELTSYCEGLPASELELGLWLEADRMRRLPVRPDGLESKRTLVREEQRLQAALPWARARLRLSELVFQGSFPYEHASSGSLADFHRAYYVPNNAVLSIAGDFDADHALQLARKYFADAQPNHALPVPQEPPLPRQTSERFVALQDDQAKTPNVYYGWLIPPARTAPRYALELAAAILSDGEASLLRRQLVRDRALARNVEATTEGRRGLALFGIHVSLTEHAKLAEVERIVATSIARLARVGPTQLELERAKRRLRVRFLAGLESNVTRALRLGEFEALWGDARLLANELELFSTVRREDVKRAVRQHLVLHRRTTVEVLPPNVLRESAAPRKAKQRPKRRAPKKRRRHRK